MLSEKASMQNTYVVMMSADTCVIGRTWINLCNQVSKGHSSSYERNRQISTSGMPALRSLACSSTAIQLRLCAGLVDSENHLS